MNSIENIINSIIEKANKEKAEILSKATLEANDKVAKARSKIDDKKEKAEKVINDTYNSELEKAENRAKLEINKLTLSLKQEILSEIFSYVTDALCNLEIEQYKKLIENLLNKYAQNEDGISLSIDSKVDERYISSLRVFKERNLKLMNHRSNIKGGFVLYNMISDTTVSFENLVDEYKEKSAYEIIEKLFN